ncbi:ATP-binding cassette domain-containing protein [Agreia bicolorata]|nr:ATP-binding cassette domain-containing protein [Agreia bicolorata]
MNLLIEHSSFGYSDRALLFEDFTLSISAGRTVLLGPNGAGKSTLLGLLASTLRPFEGRVQLEGVASATRRSELRRYRSQVGWLPQNVGVFPGLTVREHVAYTGWLKGLSRADAWTRSMQAVEQVDLTEKMNAPAKSLSGGQVRRMGIAGALVHDARAILLDEPTAGLDPNQRLRFREILAVIPESVVVVVSTHQTEDVHASYDKVIVLSEGTIRFHDSVSAFAGSAPAGTDQRDAVAAAYSRYVAAES